MGSTRGKCIICNNTIPEYKDQQAVYFFGRDTDYYGDSFSDERDPHEEIGCICDTCGDILREMIKNPISHSKLSFTL